ncbi:hypothetical protein [Corallococcus sp. 4LFB]|uniref:hypothetical protein n=1 Tax=Corallococcus sp. 4LFB TaxID=3383249 RepID=UPI00397489B4
MSAKPGRMMTFTFTEPREYSEPLDIVLGDPRVLVHAIHEVCAALRVSGGVKVADGLYALAADITARYGKLEWDAPVPEGHRRAALVQALALVPLDSLRTLAGERSVGLVAVGEAGEA